MSPGRSLAPAVVVGMGLNGLGVVRGLAARGVPVVVMESDGDRDRPEMRTRFGRKVGAAALEGAPLVDALVGLARGMPEPPVLFLTQEKSVVTVSRERAALAGLYRFTMPDAALVDALLHKSGFQRLAEAHGAPVPRALALRGEADLAGLADLTFPCILKPSEKHDGYGRRFRKAYRVEGPEEVRRLYAEIAPVMSDLIVQEWIEGDDADLYFCLQYRGADGARVASFCGRKLRSWPPRVGGTASCTAAGAAETEALTAATDDFFAAVGFTGMGSMEYKRDRRSGRFVMVEPTVCRTDFQEEVAGLNGVDLPWAAWLHETGAPVPAMVPRGRPLVWQVTEITRRSAAADPGAGIEMPGLGVRDALFRANDPLPWLAERAGRLRRAVARRLAGRRAVPRGSAEAGGTGGYGAGR